jgi:hypothetical protein
MHDDGPRLPPIMKNFHCRCGRTVAPPPRPDDPRLPYHVEITYKRKCECGERHHTTYTFERRGRAAAEND